MSEYFRYPQNAFQSPPNLTKIVKPTAPKAFTDVLNMAIQSENLPSTFDAIDNWKLSEGPILNQGQCGSCYIFATTEVLGDRIAMALNQTIGTISQQYVLDCFHSSQSQGCQGGGIPQAVYEWMSQNYIPISSGNNFPYTAQDSMKCPSIANGDHKWMGNGAYTVANGDADQSTAILNIKKEIYANGPVSCAVTVYSDFMTWWTSPAAIAGNAYSPGKDMNQGTVDGGHALKIVGWDDSKSAWKIANSWGETGGYNNTGYFYQSYLDNVTSAPTGVNQQVTAICVNADSIKQQLQANMGKASYPKPYVCTVVQQQQSVPLEKMTKEYFKQSGSEGCSILPSTTQGWIMIGVVILIIVIIFNSKKRK